MQCATTNYLQRLINSSSIYPVLDLMPFETNLEYALLLLDISCHIIADVAVLYFICIYWAKLHKLYHANLCVFLISFFVIYWCYESSVISLYLVAATCAFEDFSIYGPAYPLHMFREASLIAGITLIMFLSFNLFHASRNLYTYKNMRHPLFAIVSLFLVIITTGTWSYLRFTKKVPQAWVPFSIALISLIAAIVMFFTRRRNNELMKSYLEMSLEVKYQFNENLRVSRPLFPVLQIASIGAFIGGACYQLASSLSERPNLALFLNTIYSLSMIVFLGIITFVMIFSLSETKAILYNFLFRMKVEPAREETVIHFSQLRSQWH